MASKPLVTTSNYFSALSSPEEVVENEGAGNKTYTISKKLPSTTETKSSGERKSTRGTNPKESSNKSSNTRESVGKKENVETLPTTSNINNNSENKSEWVVEDKNTETKGDRGRGGRGSRGRGRGTRRGTYGNDTNFPRHSQTAHTDTEKTIEKGWGSNESEITFEKQAEADTLNETTNVEDWGFTEVDNVTTKIEECRFNDPTTETSDLNSAGVEGGAGVGEEKKPRRKSVVIVEETPTQSYEEYLTQQKEVENKLKEKKLNLLEPRAPTRDENDIGGVRLVRKGEMEEEWLFGGKKSEPKKKKEKEKKIYLDIDLFSAAPKGRGRGRGNQRDDRLSNNDSTPRTLFTGDVDSFGKIIPASGDKATFPSLH